MSTNQSWIRKKARKEPKLVFTSLYHHITDVDNLRDCYESLDGTKAKGVDGVTKEEYGKNLEHNLQTLSVKLKDMGYKPKAKLRSYIPKDGNVKGRPLGISSFEDKVVELAVKRVLETIYEEVFEYNSYGYRPGRSPHNCLDDLGRTIQQKRVNHVVEADITGFFNNVNWEWMIKFLEHRIGDPRIIRLIRRMLKAGIMEDGLVRATDKGTSQGSILSPLLSNVYLHYVLDLWFNRRFKVNCKGEAYYFRFADDFLACFQYKEDAKRFYNQLKDRLESFSLQLSMEKTNSIEFGRFARETALKRGEKPKQFTFPGFTHYCGKTREGYFKLKRRTNRKRFGQSIKEFSDWARKAKNILKKGELLRKAKAKVCGHLSYYAITDNLEMCANYRYYVTRILLKWLNRKSHKTTYNWKGYVQVLELVRWPKVYIRKELNPCRREIGFQNN